MKMKIMISAIALGLALLIAPAQAQTPSLFATFVQEGNTSPFVFSTTGNVGSFGLASAIPVSFYYQTTNGLGTAVGENIPAIMTMSSVNDGAAFTDTSFLVQSLKNIDIRFTSAGAPADSGDLLKISMSTGYLLASPGGQTARLSATESATGTSVINFASDYLDFSQPLVNKNLSISFSSVDPKIAMDSNGLLVPFTASATGNFGSAPVPAPKNSIPEPGTLVLAALGGLALARRRKAA